MRGWVICNCYILFISPLANFKLVQFSNVLELFFPFTPLIMLEILKKKPAYLQIVWFSSNNYYLCIIHTFENGILLTAAHTNKHTDSCFILLWVTKGYRKVQELNTNQPFTPWHQYAYSPFCSLCFLRFSQWEFGFQCRASSVGDHLIHSHDLNVWFRGDIVRRN